MDSITLQPIGVIHSPFKELEGMPIQPSGAEQIIGSVELDAGLSEGLDDLEGFSHLILLYWFHGSRGFDLKVTPFLDTRKRGLFSTRAPRRPNPIGLSVVRLIRREDNVLHLAHVDVLDGTPLLDIKPFVPAFDAPAVTSLGWMEQKLERTPETRSDGRFTSGER